MDHRNFAQGQRNAVENDLVYSNTNWQLKQQYGIFLQNSVNNPNITATTPFKVNQGHHRFW